MRIVFWGTPDFAVPSLRALLGEGHDVVAIVTQPDKPRGRSRSQVDPSPVKLVALEEGLPVLQPEAPRGEAFVQALAAFAPELSVVVAYGALLSNDAIAVPTRGTVNIHGSVLPALRGAAPLQAAILAGLTETGISIVQMVRKLDAGPVLHVLTTPILADETLGELHDRMSELGAQAIVQALVLLSEGLATPVDQNDVFATYAPKIDRAMCRLNFDEPAVHVARVTRAFDPRPGAYASHRGAEVKCFGAIMIGDGFDSALDSTTSAAVPGTVCRIDRLGMLVRCAVGAVRFTDVQPSGKPRMTADAWLRGRGVGVGEQFQAA